MKSRSDSLERSEMFTRRTATVIISAPDASCALTMTAFDEYLPVPTIRRDVNVLSAIVKESISVFSFLFSLLTFSSSATDKIHDFHRIALVNQRGRERVPLEDHEVELDGHAPPVDLQAREQIVHRHARRRPGGTGELMTIAVQRNPHDPGTF